MKQGDPLAIHIQPLIPTIGPTVVVDVYLIITYINYLGFQPLSNSIFNVHPLPDFNHSIFEIKRCYIIIQKYFIRP
jgi:hypothetical protein